MAERTVSLAREAETNHCEFRPVLSGRPRQDDRVNETAGRARHPWCIMALFGRSQQRPWSDTIGSRCGSASIP